MRFNLLLLVLTALLFQSAYCRNDNQRYVKYKLYKIRERSNALEDIFDHQFFNKFNKFTTTTTTTTTEQPPVTTTPTAIPPPTTTPTTTTTTITEPVPPVPAPSIPTPPVPTTAVPTPPVPTPPVPTPPVPTPTVPRPPVPTTPVPTPPVPSPPVPTPPLPPTTSLPAPTPPGPTPPGPTAPPGATQPRPTPPGPTPPGHIPPGPRPPRPTPPGPRPPGPTPPGPRPPRPTPPRRPISVSITVVTSPAPIRPITISTIIPPHLLPSNDETHTDPADSSIYIYEDDKDTKNEVHEALSNKFPSLNHNMQKELNTFQSSRPSRLRPSIGRRSLLRKLRLQQVGNGRALNTNRRNISNAQKQYRYRPQTMFNRKQLMHLATSRSPDKKPRRRKQKNFHRKQKTQRNVKRNKSFRPVSRY